MRTWRRASGAGTIKDFEVSKSDPKQGTVQKWVRALEAAGVEFIYPTDGKGSGARLLSDAPVKGSRRR